MEDKAGRRTPSSRKCSAGGNTRSRTTTKPKVEKGLKVDIPPTPSTLASATTTPTLHSIANLPYFEGDFGRDMWVIEMSLILRQRKKDGTLDKLIGRSVPKKDGLVITNTPAKPKSSLHRTQSSSSKPMLATKIQENKKRKMGPTEGQKDLPANSKKRKFEAVAPAKAGKPTKSNSRTSKEKRGGAAAAKLSVETREKTGEVLETPRGKGDDIGTSTPRISARTTRANRSVDSGKETKPAVPTDFDAQARKRRSPRNASESCGSPPASENACLAAEDDAKSEMHVESATSFDANGNAVFATPTRMMEKIMTKVEVLETEGIVFL